MTKKITKELLWTEIKVLNAKLDQVIDLLQEKKVESKIHIDYDWREDISDRQDVEE